MAERIEFSSGGVAGVGQLYRAAGDTARPAVLLCHGFGGTQDTPAMRATAEDFAAAGLHAITFDYRSFGESGGEPRQVVAIEGQLDDIAAALARVRRIDGVLGHRVALWGTSLGGGHVVSAGARDSRVAAVVAQVPFNGFPRKVEGRSTATTLRLLAIMVQDWLRGKAGRAPRYLPAVGATGELAVMTGPQAEQAIAGMASATWRNQVAPRGLLEMMRYRPGKFAPKLRCPLLVCVADHDAETPPELAVGLAEGAPQSTVLRYPVAHFDFYREDVRRRVCADQITFLQRVLTGG